MESITAEKALEEISYYDGEITREYVEKGIISRVSVFDDGPVTILYTAEAENYDGSPISSVRCLMNTEAYLLINDENFKSMIIEKIKL